MGGAVSAEFRLSRLMLGTVQWGMDYGVANRSGQPPYAAVCEMLAAAAEGGVNGLDTAAMYGTSEEVIGRALQELRLADRFTVVTKVRHLKDVNPIDARKTIEASVRESLRRLRLDCLPICLFHSDADFRYIDELARLKEMGLIRHAGVSLGNRAEPAAAVLASPVVEAVQVPINVLDGRHVSGGTLLAAQARGAAVFVRSVFLQGLLVMPEADMPAEAAPAIPVRRRLEALAKEAGMGMAEMAARYILGLPGVTCAIAGVETVAQVRDNLAVYAKGPLGADVMRAVEAAVPVLPEAAITPHLWAASRKYQQQAGTR